MATAWAYITDRSHAQYVGKLELADKARMIEGACGNSGTNRDYLENTLCHLTELGIRDPYLQKLKAEIDAACPRG
jgi:cation transport protein ChaC